GDLVLPPSLRHLEITLNQLKNDIPGFKRLITNTSDLSRLDLRTDPLRDYNGYVLKAFNAIAEHWAYSINFKEWDLCLSPPPTKESDDSMAARQCAEHLLKFYCETTRIPYINRNGQMLFWNTIKSLRVSVEVIGRVEVEMRSRIQAEYFYKALENARSLHDIKIELDWEVTQGDLEKLRDTL
ncbi:hypothetical protein BGX34_007426, partial [Mortierella sp. NVP85]